MNTRGRCDNTYRDRGGETKCAEALNGTVEDIDELVKPITTFLTLSCGEKNSASAAVTHKHENEY